MTAETETKQAFTRGRKVRARLMKKYPGGLIFKVSEPHILRIKTWDHVEKKYNSTWNYVAWRSGKPKGVWLNRLLGLNTVYPFAWGDWKAYAALPDAYETVFEATVTDFSGVIEGKEIKAGEKVVVSLSPDQVTKYAGKRLKITHYWVVSHRFQGLLIGADNELYLDDSHTEILE